MERYRYLILGGSMTAQAAVGGIREVDPEGSIGIIGGEPHPPYARPPLTKGLWLGKPLEKIWLPFPGRAPALHTRRRAVRIDRAARSVSDDQGAEYGYERLLIATGGTPRRLPVGGDLVIYYRTLDDYRRLRALPSGRRVAVIGGGFIGSEIAAALVQNGYAVTVAFPEQGIGARIFPPDLSRYVTGYYRDKGVEVLTGEQVTDVAPRDEGALVHTKGGRAIAADAVVAGIGILPNAEIAQAARLEVDDGIVVDERTRTSDPAIFAAGDVAKFPSAVLGKRIRVEHEDNALTMGKEAGRAMAGADGVYHHLPFFYSDMFDLGYEAVGDLDPRLETVADWKVPNREGYVYYLSAGRVRGVLSWGIFGQMDTARALIGEPGPFRRETLAGRLPK